MRHSHDDRVYSRLAGFINNGFERRDQTLTALQPKALLRWPFPLQELLKPAEISTHILQSCRKKRKTWVLRTNYPFKHIQCWEMHSNSPIKSNVQCEIDFNLDKQLVMFSFKHSELWRKGLMHVLLSTFAFGLCVCVWVCVCVRTWWSGPCEPAVFSYPPGWTAWLQASQTSVWSTDTGPGHWWTWTQPLYAGNMPSEKHNTSATKLKEHTAWNNNYTQNSTLPFNQNTFDMLQFFKLFR